jgi:hypothetical protein
MPLLRKYTLGLVADVFIAAAVAYLVLFLPDPSIARYDAQLLFLAASASAGTSGRSDIPPGIDH